MGGNLPEKPGPESVGPEVQMGASGQNNIERNALVGRRTMQYAAASPSSG